MILKMEKQMYWYLRGNSAIVPQNSSCAFFDEHLHVKPHLKQNIVLWYIIWFMIKYSLKHFRYTI